MQPWFTRRRYGWGLRPVSWQGWLLTAVYLVVALVLGVTVGSRQPWIFLTVLVFITAVYAVVAYLTRDG
jgi:hypothetical protein